MAAPMYLVLSPMLPLLSADAAPLAEKATMP